MAVEVCDRSFWPVDTKTSISDFIQSEAHGQSKAQQSPATMSLPDLAANRLAHLEIRFRDNYHAVNRAALREVRPASKCAQQVRVAPKRFLKPETSTMPHVTFVKEKKTVEVPDGANLRKEARKAGIEVYPGIHKTLNCHGFGLCYSCRMYIKKGAENVSKQGIWEKVNPFGFFPRLGHEDELRLACQTKVYGDIEVETQPEFNWHGEKFWG